ncbi:hypothetical protein M8J75_015519 [Diaphorina citri]|nr:hypothetical protein M8J75_015519 [Diaphorina citri]
MGSNHNQKCTEKFFTLTSDQIAIVSHEEVELYTINNNQLVPNNGDLPIKPLNRLPKMCQSRVTKNYEIVGNQYGRSVQPQNLLRKLCVIDNRRKLNTASGGIRHSSSTSVVVDRTVIPFRQDNREILHGEYDGLDDSQSKSDSKGTQSRSDSEVGEYDGLDHFQSKSDSKGTQSRSDSEVGEYDSLDDFQSKSDSKGTQSRSDSEVTSEDCNSERTAEDSDSETLISSCGSWDSFESVITDETPSHSLSSRSREDFLCKCCTREIEPSRDSLTEAICSVLPDGCKAIPAECEVILGEQDKLTLRCHVKGRKEDVQPEECLRMSAAPDKCVVCCKELSISEESAKMDAPQNKCLMCCKDKRVSVQEDCATNAEKAFKDVSPCNEKAVESLKPSPTVAELCAIFCDMAKSVAQKDRVPEICPRKDRPKSKDASVECRESPVSRGTCSIVCGRPKDVTTQKDDPCATTKDACTEINLSICGKPSVVCKEKTEAPKKVCKERPVSRGTTCSIVCRRDVMTQKDTPCATAKDACTEVNLSICEKPSEAPKKECKERPVSRGTTCSLVSLKTATTQKGTPEAINACTEMSLSICENPSVECTDNEPSPTLCDIICRDPQKICDTLAQGEVCISEEDLCKESVEYIDDGTSTELCVIVCDDKIVAIPCKEEAAQIEIPCEEPEPEPGVEQFTQTSTQKVDKETAAFVPTRDGQTQKDLERKVKPDKGLDKGAIKDDLLQKKLRDLKEKPEKPKPAPPVVEIEPVHDLLEESEHMVEPEPKFPEPILTLEESEECLEEFEEPIVEIEEPVEKFEEPETPEDSSYKDRSCKIKGHPSQFSSEEERKLAEDSVQYYCKAYKKFSCKDVELQPTVSEVIQFCKDVKHLEQVMSHTEREKMGTAVSSESSSSSGEPVDERPWYLREDGVDKRFLTPSEKDILTGGRPRDPNEPSVSGAEEQ